MKKRVLILAMGVMLAFGGCGGTGTESGSADEQQKSSVVEQKAETQIPETAADAESETEPEAGNTEESSVANDTPVLEGEAESSGGDVDLNGLTSKHGKAYVYVWSGNEYYSDGSWEYSDCDGYIYDGENKLQRTLTVYRYSDTSSIEYMLEFEGEWGEYWHVNYDYAPDCTFFEDVESGTVKISGSKAVWESDYGEYREIYTLSSTHEFDD